MLKLLDSCFPGLMANTQRCEQIGFSWQKISRPFLKEDNGEIISHVGLLEYPLCINGKKLEIAALHAICTKASHRSRGIATELLKEALEWADQRHQATILFTEIPSFYEKFGFRTLQEHRFRLVKDFPKGSKIWQQLTYDQSALFYRLFKIVDRLINSL
jgi:predicted N-acetyltransferase YhbS